MLSVVCRLQHSTLPVTTQLERMFAHKFLKIHKNLIILNDAGIIKRFYSKKNLLALSERGFFQDLFPDTAGWVHFPFGHNLTFIV